MTKRRVIGRRAAGMLALSFAITIAASARADEQASGAQPGPVERRFLNPQGLWTPRGFTHVIVSEGGRTVFVSGQVAYDREARVVGKGDLRAQARQVYENLKTALATAGASFSDVVKSSTYVVGLKKGDLDVIREVRGAFIPQRDPPASTVVGVAALANPDCLIEIEVIAVIPSDRR